MKSIELRQALKELSKYAKYQDGWDDEVSYCNGSICNAGCLTRAIPSSVSAAAKAIVIRLDSIGFQIPVPMPHAEGTIVLLFDTQDYEFDVDIREYYNHHNPLIEAKFSLCLNQIKHDPNLSDFISLMNVVTKTVQSLNHDPVFNRKHFAKTVKQQREILKAHESEHYGIASL